MLSLKCYKWLGSMQTARNVTKLSVVSGQNYNFQNHHHQLQCFSSSSDNTSGGKNGSEFHMNASSNPLHNNSISDYGNVSQPISLSSASSSYDGYHGGDSEFSADHAREILAGASDRIIIDKEQHLHQVTQGVQGHDEAHVGVNVHQPDSHVPIYDSKNYVNLYGVMQSNVPEPYAAPEGNKPEETHGHDGSHLNMPNGGVSMKQKYMFDQRHQAHQANLKGPLSSSTKKHYSTSAFDFSAINAHIENVDNKNIFSNVPCPQGVQGDDCARFNLWVENCRRFGFSNCEDHLQGVQGGERTLQQILAEQNTLIQQAAADFRVATIGSHATTTPVDPDDAAMQGIQGPVNPMTHDIMAGRRPYPQGIQGDDCINLKLWMENCIRLGNADCDEVLQGVQTGRKTLAQIFAEQDHEITLIAEHYRMMAKNTGVGGGAGGEDNPQQWA